MTKIYRIKLNGLKEILKEQKEDNSWMETPNHLIFNIGDLDFILRNIAAATYPGHILKRRLGFLSQAEKRNIARLYGMINDAAEKIDEIISEKAEKLQDPWK